MPEPEARIVLFAVQYIKRNTSVAALSAHAAVPSKTDTPFQRRRNGRRDYFKVQKSLALSGDSFCVNAPLRARI